MSSLSEYYAYMLRGDLALANDKNDYPSAIKHYNKALEYHKSLECYTKLLHCYVNNGDIDEFFEKCNEGFNLGFYNLAVHFSKISLLVQKFNENQDEILRKLQNGAKHKNSACLLELGFIYLNEKINLFNPKIAIKYFDKVISNDDLNRGHAYFGKSYAYYYLKDNPNKIKYLKKAVDCGYDTAKDYLGYCYKHGDGIKKNTTKYIEYLFENLNDKTALEIGKLYYFEKCGFKNEPIIAEYYFRYSADHGKQPLADLMCVMYLLTNYEKPNDEEIDFYLEKFFKETQDEKEVEELFDLLTPFTDRIVREKIKKYASKYWNFETDIA